MKKKIFIIFVIIIIIMAYFILQNFIFKSSSNWESKFKTHNLESTYNFDSISVRGAIENITNDDYSIYITIEFINDSNKIEKNTNLDIMAGETKEFVLFLTKDDAFNVKDYKPSIKTIEYVYYMGN